MIADLPAGGEPTPLRPSPSPSAAVPLDATEYGMSTAWLILTIVLWLLAAYLLRYSVIIPLIALVLIVRAVVRFKTTRVTIDPSGVTLTHGVFTVSHQHVPFAKIHAVSTRVGPLGRLLDYGTLTLAVGNDQTRLRVPQLEGCDDLRARVEAQLSA